MEKRLIYAVITDLGVLKMAYFRCSQSSPTMINYPSHLKNYKLILGIRTKKVFISFAKIVLSSSTKHLNKPIPFLKLLF